MATTPTFTHGKFVWFEHMSPDVEKAQSFYEALFGWSTQRVPMGATQYPMIHNQGQGIGGYRKAAASAPTHWICFISVPNVDASFNAIKAAGCRTMQSPTDYGPGRIAAAEDPTGAAFAMWKGVEGDRPDEPSRIGDWHWTELWTTDDRKAVEFYRGLFDYGVDSMNMPGGGAYHVLTMGGVPRAGVTKAARPDSRSLWLPYVSVQDCDAIMGKAVSLGAKQLMEPMDMPQVGRFAIMSDPVGAAIGVIKVAPRAA
jgi:uncharacterized protein